MVKSITLEKPNGFRILRAKLLDDARDAPGASAARLRAPRSPSFRGAGATVSLLGMMPGAAVGSTLAVRGLWEKHQVHDWQVQVVEAREQAPEGAEGVEQFLAGCLKGVGPKTAALIVSGLGADRVLPVLASPGAVQALARIKGIGPSKAAAIKEEWDKTEGARASLSFLTGLGLPTALAHRVASRHGATTEELMRDDPYEALAGLPGATWRVVEAAAEQLGHDPGHPARGGAALLQVLRNSAATDGHTHLPWHALEAEALGLLAGSARAWPSGAEGLRAAARAQRQAGRLVVECESLAAAPEFGDDGAPADVDWRNDAICMSAALWQAEADVSSALLALARRQREEEARLHGGGSRAAAARKKAEAEAAGVAAWLDAQEEGLARATGHAVRFSEGQRVAVATAVLSSACVLTGGPGCGKTFATRAVVQYWLAQGKRVAMCAPTGRAAQRLTEIAGAGLEASTIHRLLGYKGRHDKAAAAALGASGDDSFGALGDAEGGAPGGVEGDDVDEELRLGAACTYGKHRPLPIDCLLLDEASMVDLPLAAALFNAIDRSNTRVVIVGDPDQLPPVGPGSPLSAVVESCLLPRVDLRQIFRQSGASAIVCGAHAINQGSVPQLDAWRVGPNGAGLSDLITALAASAPPGAAPRPPSDALLLQLPEGASPSDVEEVVAAAVARLLPALGWNPARDAQVLSPVKRGPAGVAALNQRLQPLLNPASPGREEMPLSTNATANAAAAAAAAAAGLPPPAWRVGDRVMQAANDYDRGVWNGDLGYIAGVDPARRSASVRYPGGTQAGGGGGGGGAAAGAEGDGVLGLGPGGRFILYMGREVGEQLQLAWATTVHKSQGGEYPVVVLPLHRAFGPILCRTLLYTAMTRARRLLVVVGNTDALRAAASRDGGGRKLSALADRLARAAAREGLPRLEPRVFRGEVAGGAPAAEGVGDEELPLSI